MHAIHSVLDRIPGPISQLPNNLQPGDPAELVPDGNQLDKAVTRKRRKLAGPNPTLSEAKKVRERPPV